ncbi:MAG: hypothetical protein AAFY48_18710 [Bacteroidota bacterium]
MRRTPRKRRLFEKPGNMVYSPTVVPTQGPNASQSLSGSAPYFTMSVDTTAASLAEETRIVLFDSSQGYQLLTGYAMPVGVLINSDSNAQFLLNDLAHVAATIGTIKMELSGDATKYSQQFARRIDLYECKRGQAPSVVKSLYPSMGISEAQFRSDLTHFFADIVITNRHSLVYTQLKGLNTTFGFFQDAEVGRKL